MRILYFWVRNKWNKKNSITWNYCFSFRWGNFILTSTWASFLPSIFSIHFDDSLSITSRSSSTTWMIFPWVYLVNLRYFLFNSRATSIEWVISSNHHILATFLDWTNFDWRFSIRTVYYASDTFSVYPCKIQS